MTTDSKKAYMRMYNTVMVGTPENIISNYDAYSDFDDDVEALSQPLIATYAQYMLRHLGDKHNVKVLDIGAGTGRIGAHIRSSGFKGYLHALDGSKGMLEIARSKNIYDEITQHMIIPGSKLPVPEAHYDGVISVGAFDASCISYKVLPQLIEALKVRGILVIVVKTAKCLMDYEKGFVNLMNALCNDGKIAHVETVLIEPYLENYYENGIDKNPVPVNANLYILRKL